MREFFRILEVSASALNAQRFRLNMISANLANSETTRTPEGGPYRRKDVVFSSFSPPFEELLSMAKEPGLKGVQVVDVFEDMSPLRMVYKPSHPDADDKGYVLLPNVEPLKEMVNLITAARSYEANLELFNATKSMLLKCLEIGRV